MSSAIELKHLNIERVKTILRSRESCTKISLANATGLSVATCGNILKELLATGEVIEINLAESTGGRPSRRFVYNKDYSHVLVIYARIEQGKESLVYAVANLIGEVIFEGRTEYDRLTLGDIDDIVKQFIAKYPTIKVLALGLPGVVKDGRTEICDIGSLSNIDFVQYFDNRYSVAVAAENDVNCTALGYYNKARYAEDENLVYVYYPIGSCPGAGIIINGQILAGTTNFAGEVAYLPHYVNSGEGETPQTDAIPFVQSVSKTVQSINCLINPETIVLSGFCFTDEMVSSIQQALESLVPQAHMPGIAYEVDIHESYTYGLITIALEQLSYNLKIVEK